MSAEASSNDVLVWPDGTRCYRSEWARGGYEYLSDDFRVVAQGTPEWESFEAEDRRSLDTGAGEARLP